MHGTCWAGHGLPAHYEGATAVPSPPPSTCHGTYAKHSSRMTTRLTRSRTGGEVNIRCASDR
eukprot:364247-Chlamydomonas_euryale.AAC.24